MRHAAHQPPAGRIPALMPWEQAEASRLKKQAVPANMLERHE
nr:MAG TPA: hypothetical protein [Caudoviricetes sp.]